MGFYPYLDGGGRCVMCNNACYKSSFPIVTLYLAKENIVNL